MKIRQYSSVETQQHIPKVRFKEVLKYNLIFWGFWNIFYGIVFARVIHTLLIFGFFNSLFSTIPLFLLSLLLWPVCRWLRFDRFPRILFIVLHFIGAIFYSLIWLGLSGLFLYAVFREMFFQMMNPFEIAGWQFPVGVTFYLMVIGGYYSLIYHREIQAKQAQMARMELLVREAQLAVLKNQINPHFLFNVLNSLNALIGRDTSRARQVLFNLSELLRISLNTQKRTLVPLKEELHFAHLYLNLEKIRLGERLLYREKVEESLLNQPFPAILLQPLLENAIKHGISRIPRGGTIELNIFTKKDTIHVQLTNDLPEDYSAEVSAQNPHGLGQKNLKERLENLFGQNFRFTAKRETTGKYSVNIEIPQNISGEVV